MGERSIARSDKKSFVYKLFNMQEKFDDYCNDSGRGVDSKQYMECLKSC